MSNSLRPHELYSPWNFPDQNTGVGSLSLLQGIFPTQGSNPGLLHCGQILHQLSHKGSPKLLEWVVCPFSSGSSRPRNQTGVSCIAGGFFTNWAIREVILNYSWFIILCQSLLYSKMIQLYAYIYFFFKNSFPLWFIPGLSLCYTVGPCCLCILNMIICIYQPQTPSPSVSLPTSTLATTSLISMSVNLFLFRG